MPLFETETPEVIRSRVLSRMATDLQIREGSYSYDMASPLCFELWRVLMTLEELICAFYVDENSGKYLDMHAELLGMARRQGAKATAIIHFTGRDGVEIPAGMSFFTTGDLEYILTETVTISGGAADGVVEAVEVGDAYNTDAGEICRILRNIAGLDSYVGEAAGGGSDPESDAALFERIVFRRTNPSTSGNVSHYVEWARSRDGIGRVKVTELWDGPGTVRVLAVGYDDKPVDDTTVAVCADYIETQRPVGADVTVVSAARAPITVTAGVTIDDSTTLSAVQAAFTAALEAYLKSVIVAYFEDEEVYDYPVLYNRIAALLMTIDGVVDYSDLRVNGSAQSVLIDGASVPVVQEVTLS